ncbi:MAG: hypothetical protein RIB45_04045 [Marivibrio sp.]|uniref:WD40 domain-containing protein n=1 Tax=Marivibrio sp. TaxID=2039719 RepID=UPI0032EE1B0C
MTEVRFRRARMRRSCERVASLARAALVASGLWAASQPAAADLLGHGAPVRDVALSPDGARAITSGFDDLSIVWDLAAGEQAVRLYGHEAAVNAGVFLPGGRAATVSDDGSARIWSLDTGETLHVLSGHSQKVVNLARSPDGRRLATASWDRTVRLWDAETGAPLRTFDGHRGPVNAVRFFDGGRRLISGGHDGALRTWPAQQDGGEAGLFAEAGFPINDLELSPDGARLVTASADGVVRIWDVATRREIRRLEAHEGAVLAVAISPDGRQIASGGTDGRLLLWRLAGSAAEPRLDVPIDHYRAVWALDFAVDGRAIYASGVDSVTRVFSTEDGAPLGGGGTPFQPIDRVSRAFADSDDPVERGAFQFRKCAVCHSLTPDGPPKSGPTLHGIFGRRVGGLPDYRYSSALEDADFIWTEKTVSELFEVGPDVMLPGTKMPIQRLPDPQDRADLTAFLKASGGAAE